MIDGKIKMERGFYLVASFNNGVVRGPHLNPEDKQEQEKEQTDDDKAKSAHEAAEREGGRLSQGKLSNLDLMLTLIILVADVYKPLNRYTISQTTYKFIRNRFEDLIEKTFLE
jgi:hypothetical protein